MTSPYTTQPAEAFMAAQTAVSLVLAALLWIRRVPRLAVAVFLAAIVLALVAPTSGEFLGGIGFVVTPAHTKNVLKLAAALATFAALLTRRPWLSLAAGIGELLLWKLTNFIQESDGELAAAHLAFFGLLVGLCAHESPDADAPPPRVPDRPGAAPPSPPWVDDVVAFALGTALAVVVCKVVLLGRTDTADEWGDTFQAALFAKLRAYGSVPPCVESLRNYWVFEHLGRRFAQYTPGWPYFMAPFVALRVPWLAGPTSLGVLAAAVSRLGRRAVAGFSAGAVPPSPSQVRAGGRFASLAIALSSTMLINGGSRYPHVFVAAMFAWSIEALFAITTRPRGDLSPVDARRWGATLGACAALMLAARPADGATLGIGLFLSFAYALLRGRVGGRSVAWAALLFAAISALTLVILRLQLGKWFMTGYSLAGDLYPTIGKPTWSVPKPNEFKWGIPLVTGAYCWFPASPAVGLAGIAMLRGRARRMGFLFFFSHLPGVTLYTLSEFGRGWDFGYGPRYAMPFIVPMAVGTGVVLAHIWTQARARASAPSGESADARGPLAVAAVAIVVAMVRLAPLVYPPAYLDIKQHTRLQDALAATPVHHAIVVAGNGISNTDSLDLTENLPIDLYPDQDVIIAMDLFDTTRCLRQAYPGRALYRAIGGEPVRIVPLR